MQRHFDVDCQRTRPRERPRKCRDAPNHLVQGRAAMMPNPPCLQVSGPKQSPAQSCLRSPECCNNRPTVGWNPLPQRTNPSDLRRVAAHHLVQSRPQDRPDGPIFRSQEDPPTGHDPTTKRETQRNQQSRMPPPWPKGWLDATILAATTGKVPGRQNSIAVLRDHSCRSPHQSAQLRQGTCMMILRRLFYESHNPTSGDLQ